MRRKLLSAGRRAPPGAGAAPAPVALAPAARGQAAPAPAAPRQAAPAPVAPAPAPAAPGPAPAVPGPAHELADRIHSASIHLLRRLRRQDRLAGQSPARLSALSVVVLGGPLKLTDLAAAEQVSAPTMSRLVKGLEAEGLVSRRSDARDRRAVWLQATSRGRKLLQAGRARRVARLASGVARLAEEERELLERAGRLLERLAREPEE